MPRGAPSTPATAAVPRALLLVALGAVIGYTVGFRDARQNDRTVVERALDQVGASARGKYDPNVDRRIDAVDGEVPAR